MLPASPDKKSKRKKKKVKKQKEESKKTIEESQKPPQCVSAIFHSSLFIFHFSLNIPSHRVARITGQYKKPA
ncbi:MAG: hypothetical protein MR561_03325 [Prevotella sp.]|nr:hypothetical protein [Prevotella sp.]